MLKIGLLSDTHSSLDEKIMNFFKDCDEVWHAGDIGNVGIVDEISKKKIFRAVYGNIDDQDIRTACPKVQFFDCEKVKVLMTHIGGYPGRYYNDVKGMIKKLKPNLFISGHSHILKVIYDKENELLHINPGAAGKSGFHKVITAVRFIVDGAEIKELEIFEKARN